MAGRLLLAGALILTACAQDAGTVIGTVVAVDGDLSEVHSFTLFVEGDRMTFVPTAGGDYAYPLPHLRDHLRDGAPVRVAWERQGDLLVALSVADG